MNGLSDAEKVPLAVAEPRRPLGPAAGGGVVPLDLGDAVHSVQPLNVVILVAKAAGPLLDWLESKLLGVEPPRSFEILCRDPGGDGAVS